MKRENVVEFMIKDGLDPSKLGFEVMASCIIHHRPGFKMMGEDGLIATAARAIDIEGKDKSLHKNLTKCLEGSALANSENLSLNNYIARVGIEVKRIERGNEW